MELLIWIFSQNTFLEIPLIDIYQKLESTPDFIAANSAHIWSSFHFLRQEPLNGMSWFW